MENTEKSTTINSLSEQEAADIKKFLVLLKNNYDGPFVFKECEYYWGIRTKGIKGFIVVISKRNHQIYFKTPEGNPLDITFEVNHFSPSFINALKDIFPESSKNKRTKVNDKPIKNPEGMRFESSFNEIQQRFIYAFKTIIKDHYSDKFKIISEYKFLSFRSAENGKLVFWFVKSGRSLTFKYRILFENGEKIIKINQYDKEQLLKLLKYSKQASDSFSIVSPYDKKPVSQDAQNKKELTDSEFSIYYNIREEMCGKKYVASPSIKSLCKNIREYLLEVLNMHSLVRLYDPVSACKVYSFYGANLEWSGSRGIESSRIVYSFFKAKTVVDKIKEFEGELDKVIILDQTKLIAFLSEQMLNKKTIQFKKSDILTENISLINMDAINNILNNFKACETN